MRPTAILSFRKQVLLRIFIALKIHHPRLGLNPWTFGPMANTITTRPLRTTSAYLNFTRCSYPETQYRRRSDVCRLGTELETVGYETCWGCIIIGRIFLQGMATQRNNFLYAVPVQCFVIITHLIGATFSKIENTRPDVSAVFHPKESFPPAAV
jgi:hypothetical protein